MSSMERATVIFKLIKIKPGFPRTVSSLNSVRFKKLKISIRPYYVIFSIAHQFWFLKNNLVFRILFPC